MNHLAQWLVRHNVVPAVVLAVLVTSAGIIWNTRAASGSDAYGYVSEVELWLRSDLHIDQSFAASVPWPEGLWTFTPLGYRPAPDGHRIVPTYSPGLPLMMAAAKLVAGNCSMFLVVPILGGVLVLATYAIGRRLGRPLVGLVAAWIVATSPTVLFMVMAPMSDVPAAAAWAVAIACLLGETASSAAAAGLAASIAVLVRPNLVALAALLALWIGWRDGVTGRWRDWRALRTPWFIVVAGIGPIAVAIINTRLYGSPFSSGYGGLANKFAARFFQPNLRLYVSWLNATQTPLALLGLISLAVPSARVWRTRESRTALWLLAGCAGIVWISYLFYLVFDQWWYLRFLLPSWPMMAIGAASLLAVCYRIRSAWARALTAGALIAVGALGVWSAVQRDVFTLGRGEARYLEAARAVETATAPDDVIIAGQHSGSLRYYAGRLTLRWDLVDPEWLDRAVAWLEAHGHHPYFLLDIDEVARLRAAYGPSSVAARLNWAPVLSFRDGTLRLYDAVQRGPIVTVHLPERLAHDCVPPKPLPTLRTVVSRR